MIRRSFSSSTEVKLPLALFDIRRPSNLHILLETRIGHDVNVTFIHNLPPISFPLCSVTINSSEWKSKTDCLLSHLHQSSFSTRNFSALYQKSAPPHQETFVSTLLALRSYRHQFSVLPKSEDETLAFSPAISPAPSFAKAKHLLPGGGSEEAAVRPDAGCAEHARRAALAVEGNGPPRLTETARAPSSRCRSPRPWDGSRRPSARAAPIPFRPRAAR